MADQMWLEPNDQGKNWNYSDERMGIYPAAAFVLLVHGTRDDIKALLYELGLQPYLEEDFPGRRNL